MALAQKSALLVEAAKLVLQEQQDVRDMLAVCNDEDVKRRMEPILVEIEFDLHELLSYQIVLYGSRGSGKSSLWNALLSPCPKLKGSITAHPQKVQRDRYRAARDSEQLGNIHVQGVPRFLPSRPFGTCSAVPVQIEFSTRHGDAFQVQLTIDQPFVEAIKQQYIEPKNPDPPLKSSLRKHSAVQLKKGVMVNGSKVNLYGKHIPGEVVFTCKDASEVRKVLKDHCTLPVTAEWERESLWPVLESGRVSGPFSTETVLPGCIVTDCPGHSDGFGAKQLHPDRALRSTAVLCVIESCQFLTPAAAMMVADALSRCNQLCVVVTKFMDTGQKVEEELATSLKDDFGFEDPSLGVDDMRKRLFEEVEARFRVMLHQHVEMLPEGQRPRGAPTVRIIRASAHIHFGMDSEDRAHSGIGELLDWLKDLAIDRRLAKVEECKGQLDQLLEGTSVAKESAVNYEKILAVLEKRRGMIEQHCLQALSRCSFKREEEVCAFMRGLGQPHPKTTLAYFEHKNQNRFPATHRQIHDVLRDFFKPLLKVKFDSLDKLGYSSDATEAEIAFYHHLDMLLKSDRQVLLNVCVRTMQFAIIEGLNDIRTHAQFRQELSSKICTEVAKDATRKRFARRYTRAVLKKCLAEVQIRDAAQTARAEQFTAKIEQVKQSCWRKFSGDHRSLKDLDKKWLEFFKRVDEALQRLVDDGDCLEFLTAFDPDDCLFSNFVSATGCRTVNLPGTIYIMQNPSFQTNLLKIGYTKDSVEDRMADLDKNATGIPLTFATMYSVDVSHSILYERVLHHVLRKCRPTLAREYFWICLKNAIRIVDAVCSVPVSV